MFLEPITLGELKALAAVRDPARPAENALKTRVADRIEAMAGKSLTARFGEVLAVGQVTDDTLLFLKDALDIEGRLIWRDVDSGLEDAIAAALTAPKPRTAAKNPGKTV